MHACDDAGSVALKHAEGLFEFVDIGLLGVLVEIRDAIHGFNRALFESVGGERVEIDKLGHTTDLLKCFATFLVGPDRGTEMRLASVNLGRNVQRSSTVEQEASQDESWNEMVVLFFGIGSARRHGRFKAVEKRARTRVGTEISAETVQLDRLVNT